MISGPLRLDGLGVASGQDLPREIVTLLGTGVGCKSRCTPSSSFVSKRKLQKAVGLAISASPKEGASHPPPKNGIHTWECQLRRAQARMSQMFQDLAAAELDVIALQEALEKMTPSSKWPVETMNPKSTRK